VKGSEDGTEVDGINFLKCSSGKGATGFHSMEGSANSWFSFWRKNSKNHSWEEFSMALNRRLGGKERSFVFQKLVKLKQNGRVEEYIQEFEGLVSQAPQIAKEQFLGYFFAMIRPHDPKEVMRLMEIALDVEEAIKEEKGGNSRNELYRGNSGMASNARKESFSTNREVRPGEGSRNKGSRTLP